MNFQLSGGGIKLADQSIVSREPLKKNIVMHLWPRHCHLQKILKYLTTSRWTMMCSDGDRTHLRLHMSMCLVINGGPVKNVPALFLDLLKQRRLNLSMMYWPPGFLSLTITNFYMILSLIHLGNPIRVIPLISMCLAINGTQLKKCPL